MQQARAISYRTGKELPRATAGHRGQSMARAAADKGQFPEAAVKAHQGSSRNALQPGLRGGQYVPGSAWELPQFSDGHMPPMPTVMGCMCPPKFTH